uniref:Uncharacterized protein n=1 Tax=Zooxanthella nutricula TaxID=1333877 RepID=A0A6U6KEU3_9DINO
MSSVRAGGPVMRDCTIAETWQAEKRTGHTPGWGSYARARRVAHVQIGILATLSGLIVAFPWLAFGPNADAVCDARTRQVAERRGLDAPAVDAWASGTRWVVAWDSVFVIILAIFATLARLHWWVETKYLVAVRRYFCFAWLVPVFYLFMSQAVWCTGGKDLQSDLGGGRLHLFGWRLTFSLHLAATVFNYHLVRRRLFKLEQSFGRSLGSAAMKWPERYQAAVVIVGVVLACLSLMLEKIESDDHVLVQKIENVDHVLEACIIGMLVVSALLHTMTFLIVTRAFFLAYRFTRSEAKACTDPVDRELAARAVALARLHAVEVPFGMANVAPALAAQYVVWVVHQAPFALFAALNVSCLVGSALCARRIYLLSGIGAASQRTLRAGSLLTRRRTRSTSKAAADWTTGHEGWDSKVEELAHRGLTLRAILKFYQRLGTKRCMPHYDQRTHTTADVVRQAIIPESAQSAYSNKAMATVLMKGRPVLPSKMVSHSWSNHFAHLVASVVADALDLAEYEVLIPRLAHGEIRALEAELRAKGSLDDTYWICCFSVDQHVSICGHTLETEVDPVTGDRHPVCGCSAVKKLSDTPPLRDDGQSVDCEINKFDSMMRCLASLQPNFSQVIASDHEFRLFRRAWVVAELHEARVLGLAQSLLVHSRCSMQGKVEELRGLKVEAMDASNPADKAMILGRIPDKAAFNAEIQRLIFAEDGLLGSCCWQDGLSVLEVVGAVARRGYERNASSVLSLEHSGLSGHTKKKRSTEFVKPSSTLDDVQSSKEVQVDDVV